MKWSGEQFVLLLLVPSFPCTMAWSIPRPLSVLNSHAASTSLMNFNKTSRRQHPVTSVAPMVKTTKLASSVSDSVQDSKIQQARTLSVAAILVSSFLNLLGFTMAGPITPSLGKHFNLEVGASFGSLASAYPLGMLFGLFFWPALSDKVGRKPIMTISLLASGLGLAAQSQVIELGWTLPWFLAARVLTGAFAGSSPVAKAYLADIGYQDGNLSKYLAWRDAANTSAFIVGPMLGGLLFDMRKHFTGKEAIKGTSGSLAFVIGVSAVASIAAAALVAGLLADVAKSVKEVHKEEAKEEEIVRCPLGREMWAGVASVCAVSFLFSIGDSTFHAFFSSLLRDSANMSAGDIGLLYTILAFVSFSVSTTSASRILEAWGPVATCAAGLFCTGSGLVALGVAASSSGGFLQPRFSLLALFAGMYYCGVPLYGPTVPTLLLRCVPSKRRGAIMGLDGTINTVARIFSPLVMGEVYRLYGAGASFGLAGAMAFVGAFTALIRRYMVLRHENQVVLKE